LRVLVIGEIVPLRFMGIVRRRLGQPKYAKVEGV